MSAGPNRPQVQDHVVDGRLGTPRVTLELSAPRHATALAIYAAAHVLSGSPPRPDVRYQIEVSADGGTTWQPVVRDWVVARRGDEPKDFWSQSFCWGSLAFARPAAGPVRVRFRNDGGKGYARCEAHLVYRTAGEDGTKVTFVWTDDQGDRQADHTFATAGGRESAPWVVSTARDVRTRWVEFEPVAP
jgi:hypothetical protein